MKNKIHKYDFLIVGAGLIGTLTALALQKKNFNLGLTLTAIGSFWWGVLGVIYFKYISFAGHIEVVIHRSIWTAVVLIITTSYFSKWYILKKIIMYTDMFW